jgi:hypothetical protein
MASYLLRPRTQNRDRTGFSTPLSITSAATSMGGREALGPLLFLGFPAMSNTLRAPLVCGGATLAALTMLMRCLAAAPLLVSSSSGAMAAASLLYAFLALGMKFLYLSSPEFVRHDSMSDLR